MRHYVTRLLIGLCFTCTTAIADDLMGIYQLAVENDPQIKAADANRNATLEVEPQSRSALLPNINLTGSTSDNKQRITSDSFTGDNSFNSNSWSISLTQPIYRRNLWVALRQSKITVKQANIQYASEQQSLMTRVSNRYFAVLRAADDLTFARADKKSILRQLEQTKQRFDVGLIAITDVHEAQARYDQAVANEITAQNQLANSKENLREVTGQYPDKLKRVGNNIPLTPPQPANIDEWAKNALSQNLSLTASIYAAQAAYEGIERQRANHHPTLDFVATYGNADTGGVFGSDTDATVLALQLNLPIFQGGFTSSKTREAKHLHQKAKFDVEDRRRAVERQARNSYLNIESSISSVHALKQAVKSTKSALDATEAGFEVGTRTIVDVLNAQREYLRAKRDYSRSRYTYITSTLNLKQAAGILAPADLEQINTWLTEM